MCACRKEEWLAISISCSSGRISAMHAYAVVLFMYNCSLFGRAGLLYRPLVSSLGEIRSGV